MVSQISQISHNDKVYVEPKHLMGKWDDDG